MSIVVVVSAVLCMYIHMFMYDTCAKAAARQEKKLPYKILPIGFVLLCTE